jgi:hypothetical protein
MDNPQHTNEEQNRPFDPFRVFKQLYERLEPDLPAVLLVCISGACGGLIAIRWHIQIGGGPLLDAIDGSDVFLQIALAVAGACAAVFLLAKTDTTKLIHCAMIALFSGIAGPYLVTRALQVVVTDLKPGDVKAKVNAANVIATQASENAKEVKAITDQKPDNPQTLVQAVGKATDATKSYLSVIRTLPKEEKEKSLAKNKDSINEALDAISSAAPQVTQSFPQIKEVAEEARNIAAEVKNPDARGIADKAQRIITNNAAEGSKPAAQAAAQNMLKSPLYLITPPTVTDNSLVDLQQQILQKFPWLQFESSVHPSKRMEGGIEVVYYKLGEEQKADELLRFVSEYFGKKGFRATTSKNKQPEEKAGESSQFDIHLGPGIAEALAKQRASPAPENSVSPTPSPASASPRKRSRRRH